MLVEWAIGRLAAVWRGPAVRIIVRGRGYLLGCGEAGTEVEFRNPALLPKIWLSPSLAFGEGYMRGEVEVHGSLMDLLKGLYLSWPGEEPRWAGRVVDWLGVRGGTSRRQAVDNARHHYDIGNEFYKLWLDPSLTYSCGYFLYEGDDLASAQRQKVELICRKVRLRPGQKLLDIGSGWGSLVLHAARCHGVEASGVTPANEQAEHLEREAERLGVTGRVHSIRGDWRDVTGSFDRIVSVGMFEHVGERQYRAFFRRWRELLAPGGVSVLHTIGRLRSQPIDPWIARYIFPGGYLPALTQLVQRATQAGLGVLDVENLRQHYIKTLRHWSANFQKVRERVVAMYGEPFARMWWLYLQGSEAAFRWGGLQLWQMVLARDEDAPWPLNREVNLAGEYHPLADSKA